MNPIKIAEDLIKQYCDSYNITVKDLRHRDGRLTKNEKGISTAEMRQALARYIYLFSSLTQSQVARLLGYNDHTVVCNALKRTKLKMDVKDEIFASYYNRLIDIVNKYTNA